MRHEAALAGSATALEGRALGHVARLMGVDESGYRIVSNNGADGLQEVPHLHAHIFGGRRIRGRMVRPEE